jgi:hypothetical protein
MSIFGTPQVKFKDVNSAAVLSTTFNTALGDLIVVGVFTFIGTTSVADSAGNTYVARPKRGPDPASARQLQWFYCLGATHASATNLITVTCSGSSGIMVAAFWDFPISGGTPAFDTDTDYHEDTASPVASPAFNTTGTDELILVMNGNSSNYSDQVAGAGFTLGPLTSDLSFHRAAAEYGIFSSGPSTGITAGFTYPDTAAITDTFAICFKPSSGGGGTASPVVSIMQ